MRVTKNTFTPGKAYIVETSYGRQYMGTYQGTGYTANRTLVFAVKNEGRATSYHHIRPSHIVRYQEA